MTIITSKILAMILILLVLTNLNPSNTPSLILSSVLIMTYLKNLEEKQLEEAQAVKAQSWKLPVCYDDDDDEEGYNPLEEYIISELPPYSAVIPTKLIDYLKIIPMEIDQHSFNAESDLIESMPNHDSLVIISSKIDSLFDEFAGELTLLKSFSSGI
nr:hypothetical protein [Tanacetum cinerariifolium]